MKPVGNQQKRLLKASSFAIARRSLPELNRLEYCLTNHEQRFNKTHLDREIAMNHFYRALTTLGLVTAVGGIAPTNALPSPVYSQPSQTSEVATQLRSCGTDWKCFIQSAKTCKPAQVRGVTFTNVWGMDYTVTGLHEIWGKKGNNCVLYSTGERFQVKLSDELRRPTIARGGNPQQIAEYERALTSETSKHPTSSICRFSQSSDLAKYLQTIIQKGNTSLGFRIDGFSLGSSSSRSTLTLGNRDIAECDSKILQSAR